jgi:hypothetical protein
MKQIILTDCAVDVQPGPENQRHLIITEITPSGPGDTYVLPLLEKGAQDIGNKLLSPSVAVAPASALHVMGKR